MVEERHTDGDRILTLLRAEIDGRETAGLDHLSVVEGTADRGSLSANGPAVVDADDRVLAVLEPTPNGLLLHVRADVSTVRDQTEDGPLEVVQKGDHVCLTVPTAAATKQAVDLLVAVAGEN